MSAQSSSLSTLGSSLRLSLLSLFILSPAIHAASGDTLSASPSVAKTSSPILPLRDFKQERKLYAKAEKALSRGRMDNYRKLKQQLLDYPLLAYLEEQELRRSLAKREHDEIEGFIHRHPTHPNNQRLMRHWLNRQAKQGHWQVFLDHYDSRDQSIELRCNLHRAQYKQGHKKVAWAGAKALWLSPQSRPKACDPLFKAWREDERVDDEMIWNRLHWAFAERNQKLAKYLVRQLSAELKPMGKLYAELFIRPENLNKHPQLSQSQYGREILSTAMSRLAYSDPSLALEFLHELQKEVVFSSGQVSTLEQRIALYDLRSSQHIASEWSDAVIHQASDNLRLSEWRVRSALRAEDWQDALYWIEQLPLAEQRSDRWRYWSLKAKDKLQLGHQKDRRKQWIALAEQRSFYGFQAVDHIKQNKPQGFSEEASYKFQHRSTPSKKETLHKLRLMPELVRAREFVELKKFPDARREWRQLNRQLNIEEQMSAATIAFSWQWYNQPIRSAIEAKQWDDIELRFPLAFKNTIISSSHSNQLDSSWVFAVARQESAFRHDARSPSGALGLLQLMPRTARQLAKKQSIPLKNTRALLNPNLNVHLGSNYLAELLETFDGNVAFATAAYNAGPHRVKSWLKNQQNLPLDIWLEIIPFKETRHYVQNVLSFRMIYASKLGTQRSLLTHPSRLSSNEDLLSLK